ncbi:Rv3654c family TadE-like protein [Jatrophihabitans sp. GAS493]|uniref:Rv3654c family TadE-like protein n=1 Tax=Jatrophihabitans sp. GAS493 TaxID=1907575 RepID=UPI00210F5DB6|nr:Rv3654c family TadE-like protein [Jatrophihabitans sp. GAS493]
MPPASPIGSRRSGSERGAGVVWVVAFSAVLLLLATVVAVRTTAVLARHRAESAADLAALAAATRIGVGTDECDAARMVAAANRAALVGCDLTLDSDGRSGEVRIVVHLPVQLGLGLGHQLVTASARAARLAPTGG